MINLKEEIERIVCSNLVELDFLNKEDGDAVFKMIKDKFIQNSPRALWEGFKYNPISLNTDGDYPYLKLPSLVSEEEELFLVVDENNENYHILKGKINSIVLFIEDCEGLDEYYIVNMDLDRIICENDHDQLLYLDLNCLNEN